MLISSKSYLPRNIYHDPTRRHVQWTITTPFFIAPHSFWWAHSSKPVLSTTLDTCNNNWRHFGPSQRGGAAGFYWVEAKDAAKHPTTQRQPLTTENFLIPNDNNSTEVEKPHFKWPAHFLSLSPSSLCRSQRALACVQDVGQAVPSLLRAFATVTPIVWNAAPLTAGSLSFFRRQEILPQKILIPLSFINLTISHQMIFTVFTLLKVNKAGSLVTSAKLSQSKCSTNTCWIKEERNVLDIFDESSSPKFLALPSFTPHLLRCAFIRPVTSCFCD